ncbi:nitrate regulatory protein [Hydrogenophaga sp.]|uniref:nitrate regulatory protein n=1 Tax=Hydrogenophaga sp. TaxID=1904254 RepID=UPI002720DA56|nr:nitrate regulatory protein [Hydrogenophaga sp.]MDO8903041.1 nitrate- and nitrite sensing domain-containing protein [Hydrogenophaga sp.]
MKSGLHFLVAAKRCEIDELQQLTRTSALVNVTGRLVHGLQRERGLSNLVLGSQGARFTEVLSKQIGECQQIEAELRGCLDRMDTSATLTGNGARLYSRIAYVLHGLDALPGLRDCVRTLGWTSRQATDAYARLVTGLLAVVFEAADSATDPKVSRLLVALFNFMQGKEFAGQERAVGSALFVKGRADAGEQQRLLHLIESQERCLQVFVEFAGADVETLWKQSQESATLAELERMRRILCTASHGTTLDAGLSQIWFDCCSRRMDSMKAVEERVADDLLRVCHDKVAAANADLAAYNALSAAPPSATDAMSFFEDAAPAPGTPGLGMATQGFGLQLERSILELVQEQAQRLQTMGDELDTVRASLNERKVIERAKGLLMAHRKLNEEAAHKMMRQMAMNQNRRLIEVADAVLAMADVLPEGPR